MLLSLFCHAAHLLTTMTLPTSLSSNFLSYLRFSFLILLKWPLFLLIMKTGSIRGEVLTISCSLTFKPTWVCTHLFSSIPYNGVPPFTYSFSPLGLQSLPVSLLQPVSRCFSVCDPHSGRSAFPAGLLEMQIISIPPKTISKILDMQPCNLF